MNGKKIFTEILPPIITKNVKKINEILGEKKYFCPVCNKEVYAFLPLENYYINMLAEFKFVHSIFQFETLNILKYSCPNCGASDRNRLCALYLKKRYEELKKTSLVYNFLDIAPDKSLSINVIKQKFINYRSLDKYREDVDDRADITKLDIYKDNTFDIILCSHVLEHVSDDKKAISELYRVMKNGGFGILMVPIMLTLEDDLEKQEYDNKELRWKYYGQYDHVRLHSKKGFINKLKESGFEVKELGINFFGREVFYKNGITPESVLYIVEK